MTRLDWDSAERPYYAGVDHGVLYLPGLPGLAWNGLISVNEKTDDILNKSVYLDGLRYGLPQTSEDFGLSIAAYTCPDEFLDYTGFDGIYDNQPVRSFNMSYRTGDSVTGQIHLVYNVTAIPTDNDWQTLSANPNLTVFTWEMLTRPVEYPYSAPTAHVIVEISQTNSNALSDLYDALYGTESTDAELPSLVDVYNIFTEYATLQIVDNGDGTWTATGPSDVVEMLDATTFQITSLGAAFISDVMYRLSSY